MKKRMNLYCLILISAVVSGCTQVVTAPIHVTGAVVSTTIDVAGSAVHAVAGSDDEEENED